MTTLKNKMVQTRDVSAGCAKPGTLERKKLAAARELGIDKNTLRRKINRLGIKVI
jgi:transcriptional regulator of acetoin/glycerol metabolism